MKKLFLIMSLIIMVSCDGNVKKIKIDIPSVQCGMCAVTIEGALNKINGVKEALVDMETLKVTVAYDIEKTALKSLESAISNAGYKANETLANMEVYNKLPDCCKLPADR